MNYSTAVFLINDQARAIMVTYENAEKAPRAMFKTFDSSIGIDDYVVVPTDTRHNLTVCKVVEVDVDTWMDTSQEIGWIVGKVNLADSLEIKQQEETAITAIKSAEKLRKRKELREALLADNMEALKALPIAVGHGDNKAIDNSLNE